MFRSCAFLLVADLDASFLPKPSKVSTFVRLVNEISTLHVCVLTCKPKIVFLFISFLTSDEKMEEETKTIEYQYSHGIYIYIYIHSLRAWSR